MRKGIANTLALIGSFPKDLSSCSLHKPESVVSTCVRDILSDADWNIWASLSEVLPLLAEACPDAFLDAFENTINDKQGKTFKAIFVQEGSGITGWNYMSGLLWSLETLAWNPDYLIRVTVLLGQLSEIDPGGNWANRPSNSLTIIFLPWLPQTLASIEKRNLAIKTLLKECPEIGWKTLLSLLPNSQQVSTGSRKPTWRPFIPHSHIDGESTKDVKVSKKEYFEQVETYSLLAVEKSIDDLEKLNELTRQLENLPDPAYTKILDYLASEKVVNTPEKERLDLWENLTSLVSKHRKFFDSDWAYPESEIVKLEKIADSIKPSSPNLYNRRLFDSREFELYEEKGNYEEQRKFLFYKKIKAVTEIVEKSGIEAILDFSKKVESPKEVGYALGKITNIEQDKVLLPNKLTVEEKNTREFISGYIWSKFHKIGWEWIDSLHIDTWKTEEQIVAFVNLPFTKETWQKVKIKLGKDESLYWKSTNASPYNLKEDLFEAVEKLLRNGRPRAAIKCLRWMLYENVEMSLDHAYQALLSALTSGEPQHSFDIHDTTELIKWLQENPHTNKDTLSQIEFTYLEMLDHHFDNAPITLEQKLSEDYNSFCEVIGTVFISEKDENKKTKITEPDKEFAQHVFKLLWNWKTPPGISPDGSFNVDKLNQWFNNVKQKCESSGHLEVALEQIGKVLVYSPEDPSGLWIHKGPAELLNRKNFERMRTGFILELINKRGVFWRSKGKNEKELANNYRKKAEAVEKEGFFRLAASLRDLAVDYDREAEREASIDPFDD